MAIQLDIVWEGDAPGLQDHRLSLGAFGSALTALLTALRRIATNVVGDAVEGETAEVGRFANAARLLDIQIEQIKGSSSGFAGVVSLHTPQGVQMPLFDTLPETAGAQLLEAIESESKAVLKNAAVRRYLRELPHGVYRQTYVLYRNGDELRRVMVDKMNLSDVLADLPFIAQFSGRIVGVGFETGKNEVKIKTDDGHHVTLSAIPLHVENALELRSEPVMALAVMQDGGARLLRIQRANQKWSMPSQDAAIFKQWDGLLKRLAQ